MNRYTNAHKAKSHGRADEIFIFLHNSLLYEVRCGLSVNNEDTEALYVEMNSKNNKNIFINAQYRHPANISKNIWRILENFSEQM